MNARRFASPELAAMLASAALLVVAAPTQDGAYETAHARYVECMKRLPFQYHTEARDKLSRTRDPRALDILLRDYGETKTHTEFARYTLASLLGRDFKDFDELDKIDVLRLRHRQDGDAWLWYHALAGRARRGDATAALETVHAKRIGVGLRSAAIAALATATDAAALAVLPEVCAKLPKKDGERRMLVAAMSDVILAHRGRLDDEVYQAAARAYIGLLEPKLKLPLSTKMVISRHLSKALQVDTLYVNPEAWLDILKSRAAATRPPAPKHTVVKPRFFGIEAEGDRICFVLDLSDTMCKKIAQESKPAGPITGPRKKRTKKNRALLDESDIPWHLVNTRFDLAREHLKISLLRLTKDKRFCVVWFGTEAGTLEACSGMVKATPANIARVIRELDSIEPGAPKPPDAPEGTLRGRTNLHGGLRLAFALRARGVADEFEFVDEQAAALGCDTIFLLSDGTPSWDDFSANDKDYGEGKVVRDTEYGEAAARTPMLTYPGPYVFPHWLTADVRRMNAFRKAQIHCVGIGEADAGLLRRLAEDSMGHFFMRGQTRAK